MESRRDCSSVLQTLLGTGTELGQSPRKEAGGEVCMMLETRTKGNTKLDSSVMFPYK